MVFNRASKEEYDSWAEIGNDGWDWNSLLGSFRETSHYGSITDNQTFPNGLDANSVNSQSEQYHGSDGVIQVSCLFAVRTSELMPFSDDRRHTTRLRRAYRIRTFKR